VLSCNTIMTGLIRFRSPAFAYTDFSFFNALNYYSFASNLLPASERKALEMDRRSMSNLTAIFLASEWACRETARAYGLPRDRLIAIGRGANLTSGWALEQVIEFVNMRAVGPRVEFLFVGVDWQRKGGAVALRVVEGLRERGVNASISIVGCSPQDRDRWKPYVRVWPYLSRRNEMEHEILRRLFVSASFFILPTTAEAMGIVFAEASSFALPVIAYRTGGVEMAVENGVTGLLFEPQTKDEEMVDAVLSLLGSKARYISMGLSAFRRYEATLNWNVIVDRIEAEMRKHVSV